MEWDEVWGDNPRDFVEELARVRAGDETLPTLRAKVEQDPEDREAARKLASKLSNRYPEETVSLCDHLLAHVPDGDADTTADLLFLQGYAESNRGGNEAALALFERILAEFPKTKSAQDAALIATNFLSELPLERGLAFLRKAIPLVDEAMRRELEHTRGYLYLQAAKAERLRQGEEAGDDPEFLNMVAWECFLAGWHTEKAIEWARRAVDLSHRAPHILDTLANLLFRSGAVDDAIRLEQEALAIETEPSMRAHYEESLVQWKALKLLREEREKQSTEDE